MTEETALDPNLGKKVAEGFLQKVLEASYGGSTPYFANYARLLGPEMLARVKVNAPELDVAARRNAGIDTPKPTRRPKKKEDESLVYSVEEVGKMLGLTRNGAYAAAKRGDFPSIRVGKLIRIPKLAFHAMLDSVNNPKK